MESNLHEKMSKKISQLTRVIFLLNSRNDENDASIETIIDAYEKEIESLTKEASSAISLMKKSVEKLKEKTNVDEKILLIKKKFDDSVTGFTLDYDKFKKEIIKKEKLIHEEYQEKYEKMMKDLSELRIMYEKKINDMHIKLGEVNKLSISEKKIENINEDFEDKIKVINDENKIKEERMHKEFKEIKDKLIEEYEKKISGKFNSNDTLDDLKKKINILKEEKESSEKANLAMKNDLNTKLKGYEIALSQKENQIKDLIFENNLLNEKPKNLKSYTADDFNNLENQMKNFKEKFEKEKILADNLNKELKEKSLMLLKLEEEKNKLFQTLNKSKALADKDSSGKGTKIIELENEIKLLREEINKLKSLLEKEKLEIEKLIENLNKEKEAIKVENLILINSYINQNKQLTQELEDKEKEYNRKLKGFVEENHLLIEKIKSEYITAEKNSKNEIEKLKQEINKIKESHLKEVNEFEAKLDFEKQKLSKIISELNTKLNINNSDYNEKLKNLENKNKEQSKEIDDRIKNINNINYENSDLKKKIELLNQDIDKLKNNYEKEIYQLQESNRQANFKSEENLKKIKNEFDKSEKKINENYQNKIDE